VFNDARRCGTIKFVKGKTQLDTKLTSLGFDFLDKKHSTTALWHFLKDCKKNLQDKPIGLVLMDQSVFSGVGNYLRAEILYVTKISPWRKLVDVSYDELDAIGTAAHDIMSKSYVSGGATLHTFKDANGHAGAYASKFLVYGRKTDPLGNAVIKEDTPDGRTIHWVREVQK
jgi:formamidopyrimidine-DNA glycosylase